MSDRAPAGSAHRALPGRPRWRAALVALLVAAGCGRNAIDAGALVRRDGVDGAVRDLRYRIASDPHDRAALLALATVERDRGRPGAAIEALTRAAALGRAPGTSFPGAAAFGALLIARAEARVGRGAPAAAADLVTARALGVAPAPALVDAAALTGAIADLRHADPSTRARGVAALAALAARDPADPRFALGSPWPSSPPSAIALARTAAAASWAWDRGARRAAHDELARWAAAGGPAALAIAPAPAIAGVDVSSAAIAARADAARRWWGAPTGLAEVPPTTKPGEVTPVPPPVAPAVAPEAGAVRLATAAAARALRAAAPAVADRAPLIAIATAYLRDPSLADRRADDWIAIDVDVAARAPVVARLFAALGDPARARALVQRAVDASPGEPALDRALALAAAASGDPDAALVFATGAAAESGDPAPVLVEVARALAAGNHHSHALEALKLALQLAAPGDDRDALDLAIASSRALGRAGQADALAAVRATRAPVAVTDDPVAPLVAAAHTGDRAPALAALARLAADPAVDDAIAARAWAAFVAGCNRACRAPAP